MNISKQTYEKWFSSSWNWKAARYRKAAKNLTSPHVLEWLSGESISGLSNPCLKAIPSVIFQKLKTEQIPRLQLWQKRGHIITVKTDELKYFFARTNYDSSINYSRLLLILWRHWYHDVLQVKNTNAVVFWKTCCCCCFFFQ